MHADAPATAYEPAAHVAHTLTAVAPKAAELVPPGHGEQAVAPLAAPHVPLGHAAHVAAPAALYVPVPQGAQLLAVAPDAVP